MSDARRWEEWVELANRLLLGREGLEPRWRDATARRLEGLVSQARAVDDTAAWHWYPAVAFRPDHPAYAPPARWPGRWGGHEPAVRPLEARARPPVRPARRPVLAAADPDAATPLHRWRERLRRREVSAEELARSVLDRIAALDGRVRAFVTVDAEGALAAARAADRRLQAGGEEPLLGLPLAVKDVVDVAGLPTTAGSRAMEGYVAPADAGVVRRLRTAGAVVVGKTATHEFAFGTTTDTPYHGPVHNPWDPRRTAGGSSGGSGAAVAARMVPAALGTDTAGSIRIPAAACGVVGLMPTHGRVGRSGIVPLSWSCDHVGPLAGCVADAALLLEVMAGPDPDDPATGPDAAAGLEGLFAEAQVAARTAAAGGRPLAGVRVGVPEGWLRRLHPDVEEGLWRAAAALTDLGARLWAVELPPLDAMRLANRLIVLAEAGALHAGRLAAGPEDYSDPVRARLELGQLLPARHYLLAQRLRAELARAVAAAMAAVDLLLLPTIPLPAPPLGQAEVAWPDGPEPVPDALIRFTQGFNVTGQPVLSLPAGVGAEGLPVAVQLAARPRGERELVRVGAALEAALGVAGAVGVC